ncbi:AhpC/TSA family protein [Candidatus Sumerlaeota bacterium]|nr:AhpC/TSA family protein [Candidatus Sumerlaeota bacterium]
MSTRTPGWILAILLLVAAALTSACSQLPPPAPPPPVVAPSAEAVRPLVYGMRAPDTAFLTEENAPVTLSSYWTKKPVVLIYYRGGWCPYCTRQLMGLAKTSEKLKRMGFTTLAVGADSPESIRKYSRPGVEHTFLSDRTMEGAKAFGVAFRVDDQTLARYKELGVDLEAESGETHHILPVPSVFIVGRDGVVRFVHADPDYTVRLSNEGLVFAAENAVPPQDR